ncbi:MAG TPA: wax ester/triacylglycerol synthase family O-acyltransferase [Pseudonocardiaceae bacterium]|nr:wax ester/triacylglycerol synthase family O-acyltransferase [Pseudonocardiaceae bacterium]
MDRLSAQDLSMVWPEDFGWPQDIGALGILDGSGLLEPDGRFPIQVVREQICRRLHLLPRFRQLLYTPRWWGLGWPLWVDAPAFDIADHVAVLPVGVPAGEAQLLVACEELRRRRLDRSRPLWQMWFLPGLADARVGLFMKLHHAIADGVAGVAAFGALLDLSADAPAPSPPAWAPARFPTAGELFGDNLRRKIHGGRRTLAALGHPRATAQQVRRAWPAVRETFAEGRAPRTSLNQPIGPGRTLALVRSSLDQVKGIAHAHHATVNDVLSAAVAGGLRTLLASRGERVDGLVLRAFVPVSLHREQPGQARGNLDGAMIVPLPIGEADPVHRLGLIAAETAERKKKNRPPSGTLFPNAAIQRAFLRHADRQRFMNVYIANVPGPPVPLYLAGAPLAEVFPVVPLMGNIPLGIGALSYAGQFNITVVADRDGCPDAEIFTAALRTSLDNLTHAAPVPS